MRKSKRRPRTPRAARRPAAPGCPIVGVGASAGGLEAFTELLKHLPLESGFGFVLVQHLDPLHESALTQLLTHATAMPVIEVTNNLRVQANHVYVIPPNTNLTVARGVLKLHPRLPQRVAARSIDNFFEALAKDQCERAVGVILSGSATDGTLGLEAIKAEGGLTFAQDDSARFDSMPHSAVAAGCVDFVLSPANIAKELAWIARHPYVAHGAPTQGPSAARSPNGRNLRGRSTSVPAVVAGAEQDAYRRILLLLRNHCGVDFAHYKPSTILRRMTRRTLLNRQASLAHYADFLKGNAKELDALYADALINVTSFFRNEEAFLVLQQRVLSPLLQQRDDEPVRAWVLGCSTGQEAYSVAMAFAEVAEKFPRARTLQVFATDLNEANLEKARHGLYPKTVAQEVTPGRLRRFFVAEEGGYRVIKALREQVVFARHDLISDPPFSRMDLICCRNLMIYLEPALQQKALPAFHYGLKPGGCLFLGASESIGTFTHLFAPLDRRQKLFTKKSAATLAFPLPLWRERSSRPSPGAPPPATKGGVPDAVRGELTAEREADRVTVNRFAPPSVLIDTELRILQFRGATGDYLEAPPGKPSVELLKMAREGLMLPLRTAINRAKKAQHPVRREAIPFELNGTPRIVNLEIVPLRNLKERRYLVLFEDPARRTDALPPERAEGASAAPSPARRKEASRRVVMLERDLAETRDYLQSVQESQASAHEALQAANEEGQSANEELQSLNEELETSKEELESTNEELTTVNEELVGRNAEINRVNSDLVNLQTSANLVVVQLGRDLAIRRFSAQAEQQFHLHQGDLGRPLHDLRHDLASVDLEAITGDVIRNVREFQRDVRTRDGHWYSLRVRPYLTLDGKVDGAVLVLVDIDAGKRAEHDIVQARDFAEAVINTVRDPLLILDRDLGVHKANAAFLSAFQLQATDVVGHEFAEIDQGRWDLPKLRALLRDVLSRRRSFDRFEVTHPSPGHGRRVFLLNARRLHQAPDHRERILLGMQDVTILHSIAARLRASELRYRRLFESAQDGILVLDPQTHKITDANPIILRMLGLSGKQLLQKELWQIGLLEDEAAGRRAFRELARSGTIHYEVQLEGRRGTRREVELVGNVYVEGEQSVLQCNVRDITERRETEAARQRLASIIESSQDAIVGKDLQGVVATWNRGAERIFGYAAREIVGTSIRRLIPAAGRSEVAQAFRRIRDGRSAHPFRTRWLTKDRRGIDVSVTMSPIKGGTGDLVGISTVARDITPRVRTEAALQAARAELAAHAGRLEDLVLMRTAQLRATNQQLKTAAATERRGKEEYQALLLESQGMEKQLRQLTHRLLTAQEEERRKISHELHDEVVQTLIGIQVQLAGLDIGTSAGMRPLNTKLAQLRALVEGSVEAVHRFARELRPAVLDDLGLIPAIRGYAKSLAARAKLKIQVKASRGLETLDSEKRTALFRVTQEALTNVARHAGATRVRVLLRRIADVVRLEIRNDGKSFPVKKVLRSRTQRLGLVGMRERLEMVGGSLSIESAPGKGTVVRAQIPVAPPAPRT